MRCRRAALATLAAGLVAWIASPAEGASVKSVQSGTVTMSSTPQTVALGSAIDQTKAFIVCSNSTDSSNPSNRARCEVTSNTQITITTGVANASEVVRWHVVEFDGGVSVQRGVSSSIGACNNTTWTTCNVPVSVDAAKSFVLISESSTSTSQTVDEEWTVRAILNGAGTTLALTRNEAGIAVDVAWQVVQMDGASVQRGTRTLDTGEAQDTDTLGTAVTMANSFLLFTVRGGTAIAGREEWYRVHGELISTTQVRFTRAANPGGAANTTVNIAWEVVSLDDGTSVQRGSDTVANGSASLSRAISSVTTSTSLPLATASGGNAGATSNLDSTSFVVNLTGATTLQFDRNTAGLTTDHASTVAWQVISFFKCDPSVIANVGFASANGQTGQVILRWTSANPVVILRKLNAAFGTEAPAQGATYAVNDAIGAATVVFNGSGTSYTDTGVSDGQAYSYMIFPRVANGAATPCYASGVGSEVSANPQPAGATAAWTYMVAGGSALKPPIAGDNPSGTGTSVFSATNGARIVSLDAATGDQSWDPYATSAAIQGWIAWVPLSAGGMRACGADQGGTITCVDPTDGSLAWQTTPTGAAAFQGALAVQLRLYADGAFAAAFPGSYDVFYAATANGSGTANNKVVALRSDTGAVLWTFNPCSPSCTYSVGEVYGPVWVDYYRNYLYVASREGAAGQPSLWVLDARDGSVVASFANLGHFQTAPVFSNVTGDTVWIGNTNGDLYAIDLSGGTPALKWTGPLALGASATVKSYVWEDWAAAGRLYFSTANGVVRCFEDPGVGGTPNASTPCSGWSSATVAVAGATAPILLDQLYVGSWDGSTARIVPIDASTGTLGTAFTVGDGTKQVGDPGTDLGAELLVGTTEGKIWKINLPLP